MPAVQESLDDALRTALEDTNRPVLVLDARDSSVRGRPLTGLEGATTHGTTPDRAAEAAAAERFAAVVVVVDDVAGLRTAVTELIGRGGVGRARFVSVVLAEATAPVLLRHHPAQARIVDVDARRVGAAAVTTLSATQRIEVAPVLVSLARGAANPVTTGPGGVWLGGDVVPAADPLFAHRYDAGADCPPSVVTGPDAPDATPSPVIDRVPLHVAAPGEPIDEAVFNPTGFRRQWSRGMVGLDASTRLTAALVRSLRDAQGTTVHPDAHPSVAAGLAMSGVPLAAYDDPAERERASVRARRAALLEHATFAWRSRLGTAAGVRHDRLPVDVHVSTDDPHARLDLLLARRYSGADLVVLPDDADGPTECFVATPPPGAVAHVADRTPEEILASGGLVYVTRPAGRG